MFKKTFLIIWLLSTVFFGLAQSDLETLEKQLDKKYGMDKLIVLNQLTFQYQQLNIRKAIKYGKQAVDIAENLFSDDSLQLEDDHYYLKVDAYNLLGEAHYIKEHYYDAQVNFRAAQTFSKYISYKEGINKAETYLVRLDSIGVKTNIFKEKLSDLKIGKAIKTESQDIVLSSTLRAAENYEKNENYDRAIVNYEKAITYLKDKGDEEQIAELYRRIADNYDKMGNIPKSLEYYRLAIGGKEKLGDTTGLQASREGINNLHEQIDELTNTKEFAKDSAERIVELQTLEDYRKMAIESEENEDYEQSLQYYKLYNELNDKIIEDEKQQQLALLEKSHQIESNLKEIQLLTQDKEIQELEIWNKENEIEQQNKFRNNLILGITLLLALVGTLYWLYKSKQRDHEKLNVAHLELQSTQDDLIKAEKRIKTLLDQQVSQEVAQEMIKSESEIDSKIMDVTVMFLDIRDFTVFADSREPEEVAKFQNIVFSELIEIVRTHKGIVSQILGDGIYAIFGAPVKNKKHATNAVNAGLDMIQKIKELGQQGKIPEIRIGIGMNSGKVMAGNVGNETRKFYSLTGTNVIIAARIEQLNKKFNSQFLISENTFNAVKHKGFHYVDLDKVALKGIGRSVNVYKLA